jgi:putative phosphoesterase
MVGVGVPNIDHALITAEDVNLMDRFFTEVLDFYATERVQTEIDGGDYIGSWMSAGMKVHDIAIIKGPNGKLHHFAFELGDWSDILHAGDIGSPDVLAALTGIAPVVAIRGNIDTEPWVRELPAAVAVEVGETLLYMLHDRKLLDLKPEAASMAAVIYGHSHVPAIERRNGELYFNPGSAGPRRFRLPISLGRLTLDGTELQPELIALE